MFYSQFILAKKGPLGTIWIAAHLERKLRKNQVADTDIGVSVDSIICPEVPIALRLSSHLMLGVVRIYSRKVNYLFHDCSEALLKIKQAFRSTAVDLPPEESTAPYHSITLPETFDLDDFELPDNAVFDGNYVDHHVSTREQITLQDTMNGAVFSTTQFGLDERFGDGDASQIGLDLDEEMFLEKNRSLQNSFIAPEEKNEYHAAVEAETPFTKMDVDDCHNGLMQQDHNIPETPKDLPNAYGYNIRTPDLNEMIPPTERIESISLAPNFKDSSFLANSGAGDHSDPAQAPPTPGLLEEVIPVHAQEIPDMCQLDKPSPSKDVAEVALESSGVECQPISININDGLPSLPEFSVAISTQGVPVDRDKRLATFQNEVIPDERVGIKHSSAMTSPQEASINDQAYPSKTLDTPTTKTAFDELGQGDSSSLIDNRPVHAGLLNVGNTVPSHNNDTLEMRPHISQGPAVHANSSVSFDSQASISIFQSCIAENQRHGLSLEGQRLNNSFQVRQEPMSRENKPPHVSMLNMENPVLSSSDKHALSLEGQSLSNSFQVRKEPVSRENRPQHVGILNMENTVLSSSEVRLEPVSRENRPQHVGMFNMENAILSSSEVRKEPVSRENRPQHVGMLSMENAVLSSSDKSEIRPHISHEPVIHANSSVTFDSHAPIYNFQSRPSFTENQTHAYALSSEDRSLNATLQSRQESVSRENKPVQVGRSHMENAVLSHGDKFEMLPHISREPVGHANSSVTFDSHAPVSNLQSRSGFAGNQTHDRSLSAILQLRQEPVSRENTPVQVSLSGMGNAFLSQGDKFGAHPHISQEPVGFANSTVTFDSRTPVSNIQSRLGFTENLTHSYALSLEDRSLSANIQIREEPVSRGNAPNSYVLPVKPQGIGCYSTTVLGPEMQMHKNMETASLKNLVVNKELGLPATSACFQTENLNCSASSEYPEPERMLRATFNEHGLQREIGQFTLERGVTESDGSVDRLQTLSGTKRRLTESIPTLLNESSINLPGAPRLTKNVGYIPDDDDLLASILVGRTTPSLKVKPTPTRSTVPSSKRARLNSKTGASKRKVLLDDTMVLHADTIRQQLMNTEDIRRVRKKAPCNRFDIWKIQKCLLEEELFGESTLTGISDNLTLLHYRVYNLNETFRHGVNANPPSALVSGEQTQTKVPTADDKLERTIPFLYNKFDNNMNPDTFRHGVNSNPSSAQVSGEQTQAKVPSADDKLEGTVPLLYNKFDNNLNPDTFRHGVDSNPSSAQVSREQTQAKVPSADDKVEGTAHFMYTKFDNNMNPECLDVSNLVYERNCGLVEDSLADDLRQSANENVEYPPHQSDGLSCSVASELCEGGTRYDMPLNKGVITVSDKFTESESLLTDKNNLKEPSITMVDGVRLSPEQNSCALSDFTVEKAADFFSADNLNNTENDAIVAESGNDILKASHSFDAVVNENILEIRKDDIVDNQNSSPCQFPLETATDNQAMEVGLGVSRDSQPESRDSQPGFLCPAGDDQCVSQRQFESETVTENAVSTVGEICGVNEVIVEVPALPPENATNDQSMEVELEVNRDSQPESSCATGDNRHTSLCQLESETVTENAVSTVGETSGVKEVNAEVPESELRGGAASPNSCGNGSAVDGDATEFLNVGDEVNFDDENNYDVPNPEEAQSQENSGWSARTRGVARYLKLLFDEDTGHARHVVALDRLLSGKTRKEASRMFFETLVLKTKDYIHVEQEKPFANIDIKPRSKLLKLDF